MEKLGPSLMPVTRPMFLPLPGGAVNLGLASPGKLQGGRQLTNSALKVQPRVGLQTTARGPGVASWLQMPKPSMKTGRLAVKRTAPLFLGGVQRP